MFLTSPDFTLEDFAAACQMIAPPGMSIETIISPQVLSLPNGSGFEPELEDVPEDESIVYQRTEPIMKQTAAPTPPDYSVWEAQELGRTIPVLAPTPEITDPAALSSPFVRIINESISFGTDIQLKEDWACFPKNTIFTCQRNRLVESQFILYKKTPNGKKIVGNARTADEAKQKKLIYTESFGCEIFIGKR